MKEIVLFFTLAMVAGMPCCGASYYPLRLEDPNAVYLSPATGDATEVIQNAINKVQETTGEGIVFVPEGRYRITHTIYVWPGIRLIGYGAQRPVMALPDNTPGYQQGIGVMFFYAGARPGSGRSATMAAFPGTAGVAVFHGPESPPGTVPHDSTMPDANPGTFYSAMSNIDFEIGDGNPAAVAVRFHAAQHSYLAHMDLHVGSGLAGLQDIGNEAEDLHFFGGRYGILTRKPSPAWQFTLLDSRFEGQREAAIRENEAGLSLVDDTFSHVPTAIAIDRDYSDELWIKDSRFENVSGAAIVVSNEMSRMTEINAENLTCKGVAAFARFRESGRELAGVGEAYQVKVFSHGLTLAGEGATGQIQTKYVTTPLASLPAPARSVIVSLPRAEDWVNLRSLGAKGDGKTDDTAVIQRAIREHRVLYIPTGHYVITDTITLRTDTVLIGLHPDQTQFDLPDRTPGFQGPGAPRALLVAPQGGHNIVTGIGLFTNGINSRAAGALWMAGEDSLMDDVRFLGGHGTGGLDGQRLNPYNNAHTADPDLHRRWDSQYASLWVTKGGGGTFANVWTPDTFAQAGLYVSDTETPGRVYELSSEHHERNEIVLNHVAHWELDALQTEEESGESPFALSLEIDNSHDITIANYHGYRVVRSYQPFPYAIRMSHSDDIRFRNVHVDNNSAIAQCDPQGANCRQLVRAGKVSYANAIVDQTTNTEVRDREFAWLNFPGATTPAKSQRTSPVLETSGRVERLSTGFFNISGAAVDRMGSIFFVDAHWQRIYKWSPEAKDLTIVRDNPLDPVNLAFDQAGNLIVVSSGDMGETVYSFKPGSPDDEVTILEPQAAQVRSGLTPVLPVNYWVNGDFSNTLSPATYEYVSLDQMFRAKLSTRKPEQYISPDGTLFIPANQVYVQGESYFGSKWADILQAFGLVKASPSKPFYVTNEAEEKTYSGRVNPDGTLAELKVFAQQGGESLAQDREGNVYMAAGQIYVYSSNGKLIDTIDVPERPKQLVFGGKDGRTLFILTGSSLYGVRTRFAGLR